VPLRAAAACTAWREGREREGGVDKVGHQKHVPPVKIRKQKRNVRIRKRREEEQISFPKDLNANTENCRGLTVKKISR
jgi:hypothetical protein